MPLRKHTKWLSEGEISDDIEREEVEPVETIDFGIFALGLTGEVIPLFNKQGEVVVHIGLELYNAFRREGMGNGLSLSCMFDTISCVEETTLDGDKYVIVIAIEKHNQIGITTRKGHFGGTYDFKKPFPCPYIALMADSSATLT